MKQKTTLVALLLGAGLLFAAALSAQEAPFPVPDPPAAPPPPPSAPPAPAQPPPAPPPAAPPPARPQFSPPPVTSNALQNFRIGRDLETRNRLEEANVYYTEAVRICMEELSQNNANLNTYETLTLTLLRQKRYTEVINFGSRALEINSAHYPVMETMGEAYFYLNNYERSLTMMRRYVNYIPRGGRASTAYFFMGEIYRNQGKFFHADIAYTTAVTLEGGISLWWFRLGAVRESAGDYASAIEAYEKTLSLSPGYREAAEALERTRRLNTAARRNQG